MKKILCVCLISLFLTNTAHALVELRAGYGLQTPSTDGYDAGTLKTLTGFNLDAIVNLPIIPVGLGLRYESLGFDYELGGFTFDGDFTRASLLVNYRFIDLLFYVGAIGALGFSNEASISSNIGTTSYDSTLTYSLGVEGGLKFGMILLGGELGMNFADMESNTNGISDVDLGGIYFKAMVGVGF